MWNPNLFYLIFSLFFSFFYSFLFFSLLYSTLLYSTLLGRASAMRERRPVSTQDLRRLERLRRRHPERLVTKGGNRATGNRWGRGKR